MADMFSMRCSARFTAATVQPRKLRPRIISFVIVLFGCFDHGPAPQQSAGPCSRHNITDDECYRQEMSLCLDEIRDLPDGAACTLVTSREGQKIVLQPGVAGPKVQQDATSGSAKE